MEPFQFKLAQFEGPFDLLLYLVSKHRLQLVDIQIQELLEQYLSTLRLVSPAELENATEFLEMAARLVYMKSAALLPQYPDEAERLGRELVGRLMEYQACKDAAAGLGGIYEGQVRFFRQPVQLPVDQTYALVHPPALLLEAYLAAAGRGLRRMPPPAESFAPLVRSRMVTIYSRIVEVLKQLYQRKEVSFEALFSSVRDRPELVATFLAVLELIRASRIIFDDEAGTVSLGKAQPAGEIPADAAALAAEYDNE